MDQAREKGKRWQDGKICNKARASGKNRAKGGLLLTMGGDGGGIQSGRRDQFFSARQERRAQREIRS